QNAPAIDKGGVDAFATPYTVHTGTLTSGVEIQATIYDNIRRVLSIAEARLPLVAACILISVLLAAANASTATALATIVNHP
ncbi:adenylate/guanylate cyclase domain-containing protein, partial [Rhizobium ruizarguesonis]